MLPFLCQKGVVFHIKLLPRNHMQVRKKTELLVDETIFRACIKN